MRQVLLCVSILLLGLTWGFAQTSGSSETTPSGSGQSGSSTQMGHSGSGGHMTVEGCLSGSSGSYTLTDKQGNTYQLTGDTAKLSDHVGHEVKVMGTEAGADASASAGASGGGASSSMGGGAAHSLQVTSVKHVSKTCQSGSGGAMSH